jgi:hypothetical protein
MTMFNIHEMPFFYNYIYCYINYSLAIEPIYPQVCQRISIMQQPSPIDAPISPVGLSELLNSLPCCLSLNRQDPLPVYHLIMEVIDLKKKLKYLIEVITSSMT